MSRDALTTTDLRLPHKRSGKVRDVYTLDAPVNGRPAVLIVATDRISAFDVVLPTPIPGKGKVLTALSNAWFDRIRARSLAGTHTIDANGRLADLVSPDDLPAIEGRATIALACRVVPIECVVRGYLDGSGWTEYRDTGSVCGVPLPPGLERGSLLPEPIFTPATKAEIGAHDENITFDRACAMVGGTVMERLRALSLAIYRDAHAHARTCGLILADTKFEFGVPLDRVSGSDPLDAEELILVDEALTPDSSRYWDADTWSPGGAQASFDKQFVREFLQGLCDSGRWDKRPPGPELPDDVVAGTRARYREAATRLFPQLASALGA
ncbi:MAG: phosphoribosylaminoimidazolesuccinocarboxamide synthase [Phycisphaerales bacterium]